MGEAKAIVIMNNGVRHYITDEADAKELYQGLMDNDIVKKATFVSIRTSDYGRDVNLCINIHEISTMMIYI